MNNRGMWTRKPHKVGSGGSNFCIDKRGKKMSKIDYTFMKNFIIQPELHSY